MTHLQRLPAGPQLAGRTEEFIGSWLAKHPDNRAKLVLATKVAGPMPVNFVVANREKTLSGNADENAPLPRLVPDQIRKALAASLVRLQTTYVDLLQLHWPDRYTPLWGNNQYDKASEGGHQQQPRSTSERVPFDDVVRCLGELMAAGKIKVLLQVLGYLRVRLHVLTM